MKIQISDNLIRHYLRNVYFINGHSYAGKSTMVKMLAERYDMVFCGENYFTEVSLDDMVEAYDVQISPLIIGEIYVAGLGIVLISILIPSLMIMRYNPKKILMSAQ